MSHQPLSIFCPLAAIKKTQSLPAMERRVVLGTITMRTRWSIAIHDENQSEDPLITEDHFVHFADVHQRMKGKSSTVGLPRRDWVAVRSIKRPPAIWAISARARVVRQEAADEALTMTEQPMTAPWVAGVFAAGWRPPAGTEAGMTPSV